MHVCMLDARGSEEAEDLVVVSSANAIRSNGQLTMVWTAEAVVFDKYALIREP